MNVIAILPYLVMNYEDANDLCISSAKVKILIESSRINGWRYLYDNMGKQLAALLRFLHPLEQPTLSNAQEERNVINKLKSSILLRLFSLALSSYVKWPVNFFVLAIPDYFKLAFIGYNNVQT